VLGQCTPLCDAGEKDRNYEFGEDLVITAYVKAFIDFQRREATAGADKTQSFEEASSWRWVFSLSKKDFQSFEEAWSWRFYLCPGDILFSSGICHMPSGTCTRM